MKHSFLIALLFALATPWLVHAGDSKRTAEHLLTTPNDFEGKEVALDVAFVKPVNAKSQAPELAFFHAMTIDRNDRKFGGEILVAVPASEAAKFAKKYGTDFTGRNDMLTLRGTFLCSPGPGRSVWMVDTSGMVADLISKKAFLFDEERPGGEKCTVPRPRGPHPRAMNP